MDSKFLKFYQNTPIAFAVQISCMSQIISIKLSGVKKKFILIQAVDTALLRNLETKCIFWVQLYHEEMLTVDYHTSTYSFHTMHDEGKMYCTKV
jgi:hypothetical protein